MYSIKNSEDLFNRFINLKYVGYKIMEPSIQGLAGIVQNEMALSEEDLNQWLKQAEDVAIRLNWYHKFYLEEFKKVVEDVIHNAHNDRQLQNQLTNN